MNTDESAVRILNYFRRNAAASIPYCMQFSASDPGDHVVIVGGTHGNEPAGVKAIVQLHRAIQNGEIDLICGKISFLLGNPTAYKRDRRYMVKDLNRAFSEDDTSTLEGKRAQEIKQFFKQNPDICSLADLHSVSIGDFKILVYNIENSRNTALALSVSSIHLHFAYHPKHMPGTLIQEASQNSINAFIVECGNHHSTQGVDTALQHICRLLSHHNLIKKNAKSKATPSSKIIQFETIQAIRPHSGFTFLVENIKTGTKLKKGQIFAVDDHGDHIAPQDCYVVVPSKVVKSTDYDAGFLCKLNTRHYI
jgi:succinylglutamate desuccinylase